MNRIIKILIASVLICLAASCDKAPETDIAIVAEWHLIEMTGMDAASLPQVYIDFKADKTFEMYQKVGEGRFRKYDGTYLVTESLVTGEYSDGESWGSGYTVSFEGDDDILVLTADNGSGEVCRYEKASLDPLDQSEKDNADVVTKAALSEGRFL